jgi:Icc-related predicted phosphoesterase
MQKPLILALAALAPACASPPTKPVAPKPPAPPTAEPAPAPVDDGPPSPPATWSDAVERFASDCPVPFFTLARPETREVAGERFVVDGSVWRREAALAGPLVIGVVGAVKDSEPATRENLEKAAVAFAKAGARLVLVNGDVVGNETAALAPVVAMLDEVFAPPVLVHSGNYEWTSAFSEATATATGLINLNVVRDLDMGGTHLLSLPGYFNRRFLQAGACHYDEDDVAALTAHAQALTGRGHRVVLTSHGPPLQQDKGALDVTADGEHVGDPALSALMKTADIKVGIFSHILEAGGRATADVDGATVVKLPVKAPVERLLLNVGSASGFGWGMNDGTTAHGLAAIVVVDGAGVRAEVLKLR